MNGSEIWQEALRQCHRVACQISEPSNSINTNLRLQDSTRFGKLSYLSFSETLPCAAPVQGFHRSVMFILSVQNSKHLTRLKNSFKRLRAILSNVWSLGLLFQFCKNTKPSYYMIITVPSTKFYIVWVQRIPISCISLSLLWNSSYSVSDKQNS